MEPKVIFEDEEILVLDKPAGWIVNDASTTRDQPTVQSWLRRNFQYPISNDQLFRSGVVHRLDKETSGILLVAKTVSAFETLQAEFKARRVAKEYIALVHGQVTSRKGSIDAPVGRLPWRRDRFGVLPGGREAVTGYSTIANYQLPSTTDKFTLLRLKPQSGRTHQIRIHLKHIGHTIVADEFYAGRKTARNDRKWCPRLFLHAARIAFDHPGDSRHLNFTSELAPDLQSALLQLEKLRENP